VSFLGGFGGVSVVPAVFGVVTFPVNVGGKRAWVAASNPEASLISVGSLNAVPRKLMLRPRRPGDSRQVRTEVNERDSEEAARRNRRPLAASGLPRLC